MHARKIEESVNEERKKVDRTGYRYCQSCGKVGHFAKDCRMNLRDGEQGQFPVR